MNNSIPKDRVRDLLESGIQHADNATGDVLWFQFSEVIQQDIETLVDLYPVDHYEIVYREDPGMLRVVLYLAEDDADVDEPGEVDPEEYACPHCSNTFDSPQALGPHKARCKENPDRYDPREQMGKLTPASDDDQDAAADHDPLVDGSGDDSASGSSGDDDTADADQPGGDETPVMQQRANRLDDQMKAGEAYTSRELAAIAYDIAEAEVGPSERGSMAKVREATDFEIHSAPHPDNGRQKLYYRGEKPGILGVPETGEGDTGKNRTGTRHKVMQATEQTEA